MKEIQAIGVYCSSYDAVKDAYRDAALELGELLAQHKITMIYGGGVQGLMGEVANSVMSHGGRVIGFMPHHLEEFEKPNRTITELHIVDTMHTRKSLMFEHSDAFFVLPGGFGTLDETFELITWRQLELHDKPIIFININNYWTPLKELTKNIFDQHFAKPEHKKFFKFVASVPEAFQALLKEPEPTTGEPVAEWV
ncbi:MAG: Rossman fold protein, TIGR00730 family [Alphaproteobacteria bacterium 41-28]|nr:MAG: Rossman fold protein, TIGR00730 family [Alphaproteobacteria bacterium 41-28]